MLILAAAASGVAVWRQATPRRADLEIWSFDENQVKTIRDPIRRADGNFGPSLLQQFQDETGLSASASLMGQMGENVRLASAFMSGSSAGPGPDLCEIEIHSIGQFLRPPVADVGLLPLNDFLEKPEWDGRIIASRFAPWSKIDLRTGRRIIYGIPEDVHPVTITYRKDLFDEAGVDLSRAVSWDEFQEGCLKYQAYWANHGKADWRAMALSTTAADDVTAMLLQRHVNLIDPSGGLHFTDVKTIETVMFYARLVAGARAIGGDVSPGVGWTEDFARGRVAAVFTADWSADYIREFTPEMAGKVKMMALPRFDADDAPTSTIGGTMAGICRSCPNPEDAWKLLAFLYLSPEAQRARLAAGNHVLPAIPEYWSDAAYHAPDPFFADDQSIGDLYVTLARQIPERFMTPYTYQAELALAAVEHWAIEYVAENRSADQLSATCRAWLAEAQNDIQRRIDFGKFEQ
jgi:ABC-type glycerol-3-phosphate transport system substrate-binding protein